MKIKLNIRSSLFLSGSNLITPAKNNGHAIKWSGPRSNQWCTTNAFIAGKKERFIITKTNTTPTGNRCFHKNENNLLIKNIPPFAIFWIFFSTNVYLYFKTREKSRVELFLLKVRLKMVLGFLMTNLCGFGMINMY